MLFVLNMCIISKNMDKIINNLDKLLINLTYTKNYFSQKHITNGYRTYLIKYF